MKTYFTLWTVAILVCLMPAMVYSADRHDMEQHADNAHIAIFVHGFRGDDLKTWGQRPNLLKDDASLAQYDVLFWGYPSSLFRLNEDIGTTGKHLKTEIDYLSKPYEKISKSRRSRWRGIKTKS